MPVEFRFRLWRADASFYLKEKHSVSHIAVLFGNHRNNSERC